MHPIIILKVKYSSILAPRRLQGLKRIVGVLFFINFSNYVIVIKIQLLYLLYLLYLLLLLYLYNYYKVKSKFITEQEKSEWLIIVTKNRELKLKSSNKNPSESLFLHFFKRYFYL